ncbi:MAG: nucleotide exchange factor GrpE [Limnochordaceae bacterium]|nr:nucleotide exchange factor GrpE [Limnochordaceae bacterium]
MSCGLPCVQAVFVKGVWVLQPDASHDPKRKPNEAADARVGPDQQPPAGRQEPDGKHEPAGQGGAPGDREAGGLPPTGEEREQPQAQREGAAPSADGALTSPDPSKQLEEAASRIASLEDQLLRLRADFDNYRRRSRSDVERAVDDAVERMARPLLTVLDDLERAMTAIPADARWSQVGVGIRMVHQELMAALDTVGIRAVAALGEPFDPAVHQAIGTVEVTDPAQDGRVVEELVRGFVLTRTGRVLRPAMVRVGVAAPDRGCRGRRDAAGSGKRRWDGRDRAWRATR